MSIGMKRGPKNNSRRKGIPAMKKAKRRKEAEARQEAYRELSLSAKLLRISESPGNSQKEINRLAKLKE